LLNFLAKYGEKKKMKKKINIIIAVALIVALAFPLSFLSVNAASAKSTAAYIGAMPNPVGVGQTVMLHVGIPDALRTATDGFTGLTVTVIKPNNQTITLGPYTTDSTGGTGALFTPDMVGTYYLKTNFPQQDYQSVTYKASTSPEMALVVQEDALLYYPGNPLPEEYWTRPINQQLREWYTISGNWLVPIPTLPTDNVYAPYNDDAPESPHILWATPVGDTIGGLAGGVDITGYGTGDAYEGKFGGGVIIGGVLFYNKYDSGQPQQSVVAIDLHTGKTLWNRVFANVNGSAIYGNGRIAFGQVLRFSSMNYQGDFSYLWITSGTNWFAFEPLTGDWKFNMTNVPSGTNYYGPKGEILKYTYNAANGWLAQWNSSSVVLKSNTGMAVAWGSQVRGRTFDAQTKGYDWNVTIPKALPGSVRTVNPLDKLVGANINATTVEIWALSLKPGQEGQLLYRTAWRAPAAWAEGNQTINWAAASLTDNVAVVNSKEYLNYYAFDLTNGQFLWGPSEPDNYLNMFDRISTINYGKLISSGAGGEIRCYDAKTGELLWDYIVDDPYTEFTIGNHWWMQQLFIADGKVYLGQVEHSGNQPLPRDAPFMCLDIETGNVVFRMNGGLRQTCWGGKAMIADSVIACMNTYDQRVYGVGKGPSQTTVTASPKVSVEGSSVIIEGAVTDISPGTEEYALTARFPHGVPAVSDASMSEWMKYVYMQFARPTNANGIEITLDAIDPNGNYIHIGNTTSDASGMYSLQWTPEITGKYTIISSFAGTASYYASFSETAIAVDPAPATSTPSPQPLQSVADMYFVPAIAGLFVAIIVVGIVMAVLVRKRP